MTDEIKSLFKTSQKFLPSGVNSPVRAFKAVGGAPLFIRRGKGPWIWDEKGRRYLDFCMSWGALLMGHAPAGLVRALKAAVSSGTSFGTATRKEVELAQKIHALFPSIETSRLVSSGTEAVMSALRLARGFTGRKKILKIDGGYHGHADSLLVKAGSGAATFGVPSSAGVPAELARLTLNTPFNDSASLEKMFKKEGRQIAAFLLEPVPANMGVIPPKAGYLKLVRELTKRYGALLIFDEVITGFRVAPGGAQSHFGIQPDLTCLGKILGGGLPLAAFGGRRKIMDELAPEGPVYQAGTLSGNPLAVTAALWVMEQLDNSHCEAAKRPKQSRRLLRRSFGPPRNDMLSELNARAEKFCGELQDFIFHRRLPIQLNRAASMFTIFFTARPVTDLASAKRSDTKRFARFFHACLEAGLYLSPSQFEANFLSTAHTESHLGKALPVFKRVLCR